MARPGVVPNFLNGRQLFWRGEGVAGGACISRLRGFVSEGRRGHQLAPQPQRQSNPRGAHLVGQAHEEHRGHQAVGLEHLRAGLFGFLLLLFEFELAALAPGKHTQTLVACPTP